MRAVRLPSGDVAFAPAVLAALAPGMVRQLEDARRQGVEPHPDIVASVELADLVGAAWRNRKSLVPQSSAECRSMDTEETAPGPWIPVSATIEIFESRGRRMSERAVRKRCEAGTLRARKVAGSWRIDPISVEENL